jgi:hypothetical protein
MLRRASGVPIHRHYGYGEIFHPVEGDIGVVGHNGNKSMILRKGENYKVIPGEWHRFFNPSATDDLVFDASVTPGHPGFEKLLYIYYGLAEEGQCNAQGEPSSLFYALMLMNMGEVGYPGFFGWVCGLLAPLVGFIARVLGEEERLTRKFYGKPISEATQDERSRWLKKDL